MKKEKDIEKVFDTDSLKKYCRKNPIEPPSVKRGRTKKDPIKVNDDLLKHDILNHSGDSINMTVLATQENWKKLYNYYHSDPRWFADRFYSTFIYPAYSDINNNRQRGANKQNHHLVADIQNAAALLYWVFSIYSKTPLKDWPDNLSKLIPKQKTRLINSNGDYDPLMLTAICISKVYLAAMSKGALKPINPLKNLESFYQTYIIGDGKFTRIKSRLDKKYKSLQEIEAFLERSPAFNKIVVYYDYYFTKNRA